APARADGTRDTAVVLARYRLTAADHQALAAVYAARTAADPGLAERLERARKTYRAWRAGQR
ncbi:MAG: hypothetical protein IT373_15400, partial [Polyangiaceae bacterium]|nr:hypothetical protein [Polyangiaceae bacterium]